MQCISGNNIVQLALLIRHNRLCYDGLEVLKYKDKWLKEVETIGRLHTTIQTGDLKPIGSAAVAQGVKKRF